MFRSDFTPRHAERAAFLAAMRPTLPFASAQKKEDDPFARALNSLRAQPQTDEEWLNDCLFDCYND
jgi:hypothetical protein